MLARCGPIVRVGGLSPRHGPFFARPAGHGRRELEGNPEVRFLCWIKAGGQVRPRLNHTAPQRGAVQGLPGFRAAPCAGITLGPLDSHRGSPNRQTPATSWFARGSRRGYGPKTTKMPPLSRGHQRASLFRYQLNRPKSLRQFLYHGSLSQ